MRTGSGTLHARCFTDKCVMLFPSVVMLRNVHGDSPGFMLQLPQACNLYLQTIAQIYIITVVKY